MVFGSWKVLGFGRAGKGVAANWPLESKKGSRKKGSGLEV